MNFKMSRSISTLGLTGLLLFCATAPVLTRQPAPESSGAGTGSLLFSRVIDAPIEGVTEEDRLQREKLDALRGTQSAEELQELATSDAPAVLLLDVATGQHLAGYELSAP